MKIVAVTQARIGSSRLPAKVLQKIDENTLLDMHLERVRRANLVDQVIVATTVEPDAWQIKEIAERLGISCFMGSVDDVLDRFYQAVKNEAADFVVRITSDCPLIDPELIDEVIKFAVDKNADYVSNTLRPSFPDGQDIEVIKYSALKKAWVDAKLKSEREHVTPYIWKNSTFHQQQLFSSYNFAYHSDYCHVRLTVDELRDLETIKLLVQRLGRSATWLDYADYYKSHLQEMSNYDISRNAGYAKSLLEDKVL